MTSANNIASYLNKLLLLDKPAVEQLFKLTVGCNKTLAEAEKFLTPAIDVLTVINESLIGEVVIMHTDEEDNIMYFSWDTKAGYQRRVEEKKARENLEAAFGLPNG